MAKKYPVPQPPPSVPDAQPDPGPTPRTLRHMREVAVNRATGNAIDTARTIAELEAWRAEIEATIAFLKAQR